jgi:hypothetical protein
MAGSPFLIVSKPVSVTIASSPSYIRDGGVITMKIFENIINHKINTITGDELLKYANQFKINVTRTQAQKIAEYLRGRQVNIFDSAQRASLIKEIAKVTDVETAREVNKLFVQFTK